MGNPRKEELVGKKALRLVVSRSDTAFAYW
jgi:hypothetical protein